MNVKGWPSIIGERIPVRVRRDRINCLAIPSIGLTEFDGEETPTPNAAVVGPNSTLFVEDPNAVLPQAFEAMSVLTEARCSPDGGFKTLPPAMKEFALATVLTPPFTLATDLSDEDDEEEDD
ncbi:MAG: hypothetical protein ACE5JS_20210 [Nitrospinota bacterium]